MTNKKIGKYVITSQSIITKRLIYETFNGLFSAKECYNKWKQNPLLENIDFLVELNNGETKSIKKMVDI